MKDTRRKDADWIIPDHLESWHPAHAALLMDLRDELKGIRATLTRLTDVTCSVFECANFLRMPTDLRKIARNTAKT